MKIKICGLFREQDIEYVNEALPDYVGFVFAESRRQVTAGQAEALKQKLAPGILAVGVFRDAPLEEPALLLKAGVIDMAQLHGGEDEEYVIRLKTETRHPVIKAIRVKREEDIEAARGNPADFLLLDHGMGGTGQTFDWSLVQECGKPFFLAGGIHAGNLEQAMKTGAPFVAGPYAIDVSSGAETGGIKDREKILEIVRRIRNG
ncbi:MAG TPA: phosphoribosylanthranilate isomerase [Anaerovoracaceae bacterium]|nr:phosphoribosylanthranilate isomerase [Anaerovoracaceae bacterium]